MVKDLKQRLVGASVIIALAVIFIPMLFDNNSLDTDQTISIKIPQEPEDLKRRVISIDTGNVQKEEVNVIQSEKKITPIHLPKIKIKEVIIDVDKYNDVSITKPPAKPLLPIEADNVKPKKVINQVTLPDDYKYRIKIGSFSKQKNAQQIKAKMINAGYQVIVEKNVNTSLYDVFSKQYESKNKAQSISRKLSKLNLNIGKTSIEKLDKLAQENSQLLVDTGWIVQIGIFSNKVNSMKLRDKIRNKGFVTFVDEIKGKNNTLLYRVRVGPFATNKEAKKTKKDIKVKMSLDGILKPHEKQKVVVK